MTVCIQTFGCQMNKLDSQLLRGELTRRGFVLTDDPDLADAVIYNTCSVRAHAEDRVWSRLGTIRRRAERDKGFVVGVIGCMAQRVGAGIVRRFDFVKLVCGTKAFLKVPGYLEHIRAGEGPFVDVSDQGQIQCNRVPGMRASPHSAYVSIMRGCDNFCSYCIVPYVRGREVSRHPDRILEEVRALADGGVREITLLGQNVNSYGLSVGADGVRLPDLLARLNEVGGIQRIRFITSHPKDMSDAVLDAVAELTKVCEHLHVPAQSGSDAVLGRMGRGYTASQYRAMADRAREKVRGIALASDFMVGFPGETKDDFAATLQLVREVRFQQSFVFKYSPRPGTRASEWADGVPHPVKRERNQMLLDAQQQIDSQRRGAMVGRDVEVLVDGVSKLDPSHLSGRTRQNDIVVLKGPKSLAGRLVRVRVTDSTPLTLFGLRAQPPDG
jgi:tRNA-2-methylthio-N6-dimethylallyladenosine synthase